jgi:hypothetical protein
VGGRFTKPRALIFALLLGLLGGCESFKGNLLKNNYWDSIHDQSNADERARLEGDPATTFFLGIRTTAREVPFQVGIVISNVYAEGPAARAGLRAGDEIRRIHHTNVRTPGEARLELTRIFREAAARIERYRKSASSRPEDDPYIPTEKIRIIYFRDGRQIETEVQLTTREGYLDLRRRRVLDLSRYTEQGWNGIYFWKTRTLAPEFVEDYFGVLPPRTVRVAQDLDILPLAFGFSLVRVEAVPIADATRVTVLTSLLQFSHRGTDVARTLESLIPPPPGGTTDL